MKTIYEAYLENSEKIYKLEEEVYKEKYLDLFNKFIFTDFKNSEKIFNELYNIKNYKDRYDFLINIFSNPKKKSNYYDKISMDYLNKIRNL